MKKYVLFLIGISLFVSPHTRAQTQPIMTENKLNLRDNQVRMHYLQAGEGELTLLFLHGWCINSTYWKGQIAHFSKTHAVYAIDLPGFGKSSAQRENWTIEEYAKDVNAFIEELDLQHVVLVGHSMSGDVMLQAALDAPEKIHTLIGVDNFQFIDVEFSPEQMEEMTAFFPLLEKDFKHSAPIYAENMLFQPSTSTQVRERVKQDFGNTDPIIGYNSFLNLMEYASHSAQKLEQLNHRLHLINSDAIPTNTQGLSDHCKNGFVVKDVSATGHYPMIEKADEFNQRLEEVLESLSED